MRNTLFLNAWLTAMVLLTAPQSTAQEGQQSDICRLQLIASLEMRTMPDGRVTVPVKVDGHQHWLLVDTGGYINTLNELLVKQEGYKPVFGGASLRGMGATVLNSYVQIKDFTLGNAHGKDFRFYVDHFASLSMEGTLAPQVLANYDVDFDFVHEKLNLIAPNQCPGRVVYWTKTGAAIVPMQMQQRTHIRIPIQIDGKEMMATVDTGAVKSYVTRKAAARLLGIDEKSPGFNSPGNVTINNMTKPVYNYPFKTLTFGDVTVNNPRIVIVSDEVWDSSDLLLGIGILRQMHVYIAYAEKKLYLTSALAN